VGATIGGWMPARPVPSDASIPVPQQATANSPAVVQ
jgi:hypothetical protein